MTTMFSSHLTQEGNKFKQETTPAFTFDKVFQHENAVKGLNDLYNKDNKYHKYIKTDLND